MINVVNLCENTLALYGELFEHTIVIVFFKFSKILYVLFSIFCTELQSYLMFLCKGLVQEIIPQEMILQTAGLGLALPVEVVYPVLGLSPEGLEVLPFREGVLRRDVYGIAGRLHSVCADNSSERESAAEDLKGVVIVRMTS